MFLFNVKKKRKRGVHTKKRFTFWHNIREYVYPSIGMRGYLRFLEIRIKRQADTTHRVSIGFAAGAFASFTPYIGLHIVISILVARVLRGNLLAAIIGTVIGNPATFPFIWSSSYRLGEFVLGRSASPEILYDAFFARLTHGIGALFSSFFQFFISLLQGDINLDVLVVVYQEIFVPLLLPMTVGGAIIGGVASFILYWLIRFNIENYRRIRLKRLQKRRQQAIEQRKAEKAEARHD